MYRGRQVGDGRKQMSKFHSAPATRLNKQIPAWLHSYMGTLAEVSGTSTTAHERANLKVTTPRIFHSLEAPLNFQP